jgi:hypothetical protein
VCAAPTQTHGVATTGNQEKGKHMCKLPRRKFGSEATTALLIGLGLLLGAFGTPNLKAAPKLNDIDVIPTITSIGIQNGQLVASGTATAIVRGKTNTVPFTAPVTLSLATNQTNTAGCPILDLALGPINLDLLGLVVETSPICLEITAIPGGGLLGDLLCGVANLLNGGLNLDQILGGLGVGGLPGLTTTQVSDLLSGVGGLLNGVLGNLLDAVATDMIQGTRGVCDILHLELGPLDLNLLGLEVVLDDCAGGPVVVDITGERGRGNLLGNLLCGLLGSGRAGLGSTLGDILGQLLH